MILTAAQRPTARPSTAPFLDAGPKFLFVLAILLSTYDKSGLLLGAGEQPVSITPYKILFALTAVYYLAAQLIGPRRPRVDRYLLRIILVYVIGQTVCSLVGLLTTEGPISLSSEIYYLIQRSSVLFIPLLAIRFGIAPRAVLAFFVTAILLHDLFVILQFASTDTYLAFVQYVGQQELRPDNVLGWDEQSLVFIGLQRTANYGAFAMAFGILGLAFSTNNVLIKLVFSGLITLSLLDGLFGGSRTVLVMLLVTLAIYMTYSKHRLGLPAYYGVLLCSLFTALLYVTSIVTPPDSAAIGPARSLSRLIDGSSEGSDLGKMAILEYGRELVGASPVVGWGQRRFAEISAPVGNESDSTSYVHFYWLGTAISTGVVGLALYVALFLTVARRLWQYRGSHDFIVFCVFMGLGAYNLLYDAGSLDIFACFFGVAAYFGLVAPEKRWEARPLGGEAHPMMAHAF